MASDPKHLIPHVWADSLLRSLGMEDGVMARWRLETKWLRESLAEDFLPDTLEWLLPLVLERWPFPVEELMSPSTRWEFPR